MTTKLVERAQFNRMSRLLLIAWTLSLLLPIQGQAVAGTRVVRFSFPSEDGRAQLSGELDYPAAIPESTRVPVVIMIPGTGLWDRDVYLGQSGTDADFIFRDLAYALNERGIAALRMDQRGVRCNAKTMPACPSCSSAAELQKHYIDSCLNKDERATVSFDSIEDDIAQAYSFAATSAGADPSRILIFAHSEGTLHAANLVNAGRIAPSGMVFMGFASESPQSTILWQQVGRFMRILNWDTSHDGKLTNAEIDQGYRADPYFSRLGVTSDQLHSATGYWTASTLEQTLEHQYQDMVQEALTHADSEPYSLQEVPFTSYAWWKRYLTDSSVTAAKLIHYPGIVIAHNGDDDTDTQTPGNREFGIAAPYANQMPHPAKLVLHAGYGHTLRKDTAIYGPIDPAIRTQLLDDISAVAGSRSER